jgi:hypothetical protein
MAAERFAAARYAPEPASVEVNQALALSLLFEHDRCGRAQGHAFGNSGFHPRIKSEAMVFFGSCFKIDAMTWRSHRDA